jgi:glycosyltransferase involved in cell wall biosynthesis
MDVSTPKVSILLATFNGAEFLPEQLQSFCDQTYFNWELLVSDDGSVDQTTAIVEAFAKRVPQKVTLRQGPRNAFWQNFLSMVRLTDVESDLFAYSDQDDVWLPEKLARSVDWFASIPQDQPGLYFTRTMLISPNGKPLGYSRLFERGPSFQNALVQNIGGGNTMVFNRAAKLALAATPPDVELIAHDWWTYQIVAGVGGLVHYDPLPSIKYRQHPQNLIGSNLGFRQRSIRLKAFMGGRVVNWNDTNIKALNRMRHLLSPSSQATLDRFARARTSVPPRNIYLLWKAGVYRQNAIETAVMFSGTLFGRV